MENRELVAFVLGKPDLGIVELQLEAVRRRRGVVARLVALRLAVAEQDETASFVRHLALGVRDERFAHVGGNHHQTVRSIACSTSSFSQKSAERYFQPASARIATTTPSSSSSASFRATCPTAPADTPAKMPSSSSSRRTSCTDSSFVTSTLRSSFETSRIGGTYPSSSERRPMTGSPGSGSAAATTMSGNVSRRRPPVPISVPPVPSPATTTSTRSSASAISAPVPS